jgi:hypothetical protein
MVRMVSKHVMLERAEEEAAERLDPRARVARVVGDRRFKRRSLRHR